MSRVELLQQAARARLGLKGPHAPQWLLEQGLELPGSANSWLSSSSGADAAQALLIARLGASEFFLEQGEDGKIVRALAEALAAAPTGVYPVLREDAAFCLSGEGAHDVLAQVCSIDFARLSAGSRGVIMTLMIGVAVLVIAEDFGNERRYRIWCDPSFGPYMSSTLGAVVKESGGKITGVSA